MSDLEKVVSLLEENKKKIVQLQEALDQAVAVQNQLAGIKAYIEQGSLLFNSPEVNKNE